MSDIEDFDEQELGVDGDRDANGYGSSAVSVQQRHKKKPRRRDEDDDEEEEEEEEDDDEDEDEDEDDDDDDEGISRGKKRRKVKKRPVVNRFLDLVADVDDDEDEDEEEEDGGRDAFFDEAGAEGEDFDDINRRAAHHARLDRRDRELNDEDLAGIAEDLTRRYRPTAQKYTGDMNEIPQRLLMPSVQDASLWQVRVRPGKERDIVFSLMRKALDQEFSTRPLRIMSAFQRDSLPGMIYVEARSSLQVNQAVTGLVGVFPSRGITLVPIEEMASLLQIKQKDTNVVPGNWVRVRRGKYGGDLAQVIDIAETGEEIGLKFVPRIDMNPKDEVISADGKKRKLKGAGFNTISRPPQRFFNYEEIVKVYGRRAVAKRNQVFVFNNDTFKDGYIEKDFKLSALILDNVNPTLDEIMKFSQHEDGTEDTHVDLSVIAEAAKKEAIQVLQPGDHVEVFEGEQAGVHGIVDAIANEIVTLRAIGVDIEGQKVDVPARSVRKRFKVGDHVKVMSGQNVDETGLVVSVIDNIVTFLSDMSMQEISVFSKDLREAAEVGTSTNVIGNYELHDLVQLDQQSVGVIFKTERDSFRVLDQSSQVRQVLPHQIVMRLDSHRASATDSEGHQLRIKDNVKEVEGEGRKGQILHIHQAFYAFLYNREISENDGVFVTRTRSLASLAPKGNVSKHSSVALNLSSMNPAVSGGAGGQQQGGMVGSQAFRGPRDYLIGVNVIVIKGPQKGLFGIVKDTNGQMARVELQVGNRMITIDKSKLKRKNPDGSTEVLERVGHAPGREMTPGFKTPAPPPSWGTPTLNPYASPAASGGKTPGWGMGRTPNPYASGDSRTPAWNGGRTPNPYADGSKTPAWNSSKTPGWGNANRTPNPYANNGSGGGGWGSASGGKTPAHQPSTTSSGWGKSPAWQGGSSSSWDVSTPYQAPTPTSAPTPGATGWGDDAVATPWGGGDSYGESFNTPAVAATPWGGNEAATPYAAQMESMTSSASTAANAPWWTADRELLKNIVVVISGSKEAGQEWFDGKFENKEALVVAIADAQSADSSYAFVKLLPNMEDHRVPLRFLDLRKPTVGDNAVMLTGPYKGERGNIMPGGEMLENENGAQPLLNSISAKYVP